MKLSQRKTEFVGYDQEQKGLSVFFSPEFLNAGSNCKRCFSFEKIAKINQEEEIKD